MDKLTHMHLLSLDIGTRHTGVAFYDSATGIPLPLSTIHHKNRAELLAAVRTFKEERSIDRIIVGMPLLPSGDEGSQARLTLEIVDALRNNGFDVETIDERYSTPKQSKGIDPDAAAACGILEMYVARQ